MGNKDNIELRSEKTRHVIGRIPPLLIRTGTMVITLMVIAMAVAVRTIHYPITIEARGEVAATNDTMQARLLVPYKHIGMFDEQRTANIEFEGNDKVFSLPVTSHSQKLISVNGQNYFEADVNISKNKLGGLLLQPKQKVAAEIMVSDKTIWQLLGF